MHRAWITRPSEINAFAKKYGERGSEYGVYYGVCKRKGEGGKKEDVMGATALWVDVDAEVNGQKTEDIFQALGLLHHSIQPSAVVHSGGGIHCFWFLDRLHTNAKQIEDANKVVMEMMGGDACWDVTRVLRLPDTYNNKRPTKKLCHVRYCAEHIRYDLDDLVDRILTFGRVLNGSSWVDPKKLPKREEVTEATALHPYAGILLNNGKRTEGQLWKIWDERVRDGAPRGYLGVHEATIISAARLYCNGYSEDQIVKKVMDWQRTAPGVDTSEWDWQSEERKIRQCLVTWGAKWKELKKRNRATGGADGRT